MTASSQHVDPRVTCMLRVVLTHFEDQRITFPAAVSLLECIITCDRHQRTEAAS